MEDNLKKFLKEKSDVLYKELKMFLEKNMEKGIAVWEYGEIEVGQVVHNNRLVDCDLRDPELCINLHPIVPHDSQITVRYHKEMIFQKPSLFGHKEVPYYKSETIEIYSKYRNNDVFIGDDYILEEEGWKLKCNELMVSQGVIDILEKFFKIRDNWIQNEQLSE